MKIVYSDWITLGWEIASPHSSQECLTTKKQIDNANYTWIATGRDARLPYFSQTCLVMDQIGKIYHMWFDSIRSGGPTFANPVLYLAGPDVKMYKTITYTED